VTNAMLSNVIMSKDTVHRKSVLPHRKHSTLPLTIWISKRSSKVKLQAKCRDL